MDGEPASHLFRTADLRRSGIDDEEIRRKVRRGELARIRRGTYCLGSVWVEAKPRERHLLRAAAVVADTAAPILALRSAAALWDIPILGADESADVTLLTSHVTGGKSEPGVRRTFASGPASQITVVRGLPVTSAAQTVVDLAAAEGFVAGVMAADWALRSGISRDELDTCAEARVSSRGRSAIVRSLSFADPRAENGGESAARAAIYRVGFEVPDLQCVFHDAEGEIRTDFWWPGVRRAGEFDGRRKYLDREFTQDDPAHVIWREKRREDRLRRQVDGVVRLVWDEIRAPAVLMRLLAEAGVPRR